MWSPEEWLDNLRREVTEEHATAVYMSESHADPRKANGASEYARALAWVLSRLDDAARVSGPQA